MITFKMSYQEMFDNKYFGSGDIDRRIFGNNEMWRLFKVCPPGLVYSIASLPLMQRSNINMINILMLFSTLDSNTSCYGNRKEQIRHRKLASLKYMNREPSVL